MIMGEEENKPYLDYAKSMYGSNFADMMGREGFEPPCLARGN